MASILVTGAAGFIGYHTADKLLKRGDRVVGIDNLNDYYSPQLKRDRLAQLSPHAGFQFVQLGLEDRDGMNRLFAENQFDSVIHLAAQAGVAVLANQSSGICGFQSGGLREYLEACRHNRIGHLVYASSSSVYGANRKIPFQIEDRVDHPVSLYAATKKSNE